MDLKDVENLAALARIELSQDEKQELLKDIESILGYIQQIKTVKFEEIESEYKLYNVWREDVVLPRDFSRELIVQQFPDAQNDFLKVKKII